MQQVAGLRVQGGEGFVHQQDIWLGGQRAGQGYPLPHSPGKLVDVAVRELRELYQAQVIPGFPLALCLRNALHLQAEFDIVCDRQPGKEPELLENQDPVSARPVYRLAVNQDTARRGLLQPGNQMQQRGLAASRRADNAEKLAGFDLQVDSVKRQQSRSVGLVLQRNILQRNFGSLLLRRQICKPWAAAASEVGQAATREAW